MNSDFQSKPRDKRVQETWVHSIQNFSCEVGEIRFPDFTTGKMCIHLVTMESIPKKNLGKISALLRATKRQGRFH